MTKVYLSMNDPFIIDLMDEDEVNETFGDDFLDDYGIDVPDELIESYKKAYAEFWKVQKELEKFTRS